MHQGITKKLQRQQIVLEIAKLEQLGEIQLYAEFDQSHAQSIATNTYRHI